MNTFFGDWSKLAGSPQDNGLRQVVLEDGNTVAKTFQTLNSQLGSIQADVTQSLSGQVKNADALASQIAALNSQIPTAEAGASGQANALRDQRDAVVKQLSQLVNLQTVPQSDGTLDVYVGSEPLVAGTKSLGIAVGQQVVNGQTASIAVFKSNGGNIPVTSGQIGALESVQGEISTVNTQLDNLAHQFIFELNKVHSSGQGTQGISTVTSTSTVADPAAALASAGAGLKFPPANGSFVVHVTDKATGLTTSTLVAVKETGQPTDTTLNSLQTSLAAIGGVNASINGGRLTVAAASSGQTISFSQDSSGVLAALGINTFYTGTDASDIAVNPVVSAQPELLAAAQNGDAGDNKTALAIASLGSEPVSGLNGISVTDAYQALINGVSVKAASAKTEVQATQAVQDTLQSQRDSLSGVSLDEETVHLLQQQTAYQGAAKLISVVDQMMQTLLGMVVA